jgi:hypothetical protein
MLVGTWRAGHWTLVVAGGGGPITPRFTSPAAGSDDGARWVAPRAPALEGGARAGLRLARRSHHQALPWRRSDVKVLMGGVLQAFRGWAVEDYQAAAENYLHRTQHPALGRGFCDCSYRPMVELLRYLEANGFTTYITSGATAISCGPSPRSTTTPPARRNCSSEQEHRDGR